MALKFDLSKVDLNPPHLKLWEEGIGNQLYKPPPVWEDTERSRRYRLGFYDNRNEVDGCDLSSWEARKSACTVSPSVVGLSSNSSSEGKLRCSGVVVELIQGSHQMKKILTSAYILGAPSDSISEVDIIFADERNITGYVVYVDKLHNVALISADLANVAGVNLSDSLVNLGEDVVALGRHSSFDPMFSRGKTNIRGDLFDSDDLMSSSCTIPECGIGGPLIELSTGNVVGINFFGKRNSTPFMPSKILIHCLDDLLDKGQGFRPCVGLKVRSLKEKKAKELEVIYMTFPSVDGVTVNEVIEGSVADEAGICTGDIISVVNDIPISSPVELSVLLYKLRRTRTASKRTRKSINIVTHSLASGDIVTRRLLVRSISTDPRGYSWSINPTDYLKSKEHQHCDPFFNQW